MDIFDSETRRESRWANSNNHFRIDASNFQGAFETFQMHICISWKEGDHLFWEGIDLVKVPWRYLFLLKIMLLRETFSIYVNKLRENDENNFTKHFFL